jgi:hypothetical protein
MGLSRSQHGQDECRALDPKRDGIGPAPHAKPPEFVQISSGPGELMRRASVAQTSNHDAGLNACRAAVFGNHRLAAKPPGPAERTHILNFRDSRPNPMNTDIERRTQEALAEFRSYSPHIIGQYKI